MAEPIGATDRRKRKRGHKIFSLTGQDSEGVSFDPQRALRKVAGIGTGGHSRLGSWCRAWSQLRLSLRVKGVENYNRVADVELVWIR
jgi:hypothetical protein